MKKSFILILFALFPLFVVGKNVPNWDLGVSISLLDSVYLKSLKSFKDHGFKYVEVVLPGLNKLSVKEYVKKIDECKRLVEGVGMEIWSVHIPFNWDYDISSPDPVKQETCRKNILFVLDIAKGLGNYQKAVLHPSFEPIKKEERAARIASLKKILKDLGPFIVEKYSVRLAIEDLPRTCLGNSSAEMLNLISENEFIDVCFDVNHLLTEKTETFAIKLGNRIKTLHISDYDGVDEKHWLPGKGIINWVLLVDALVKNNYKGPFMFEVTKTPWRNDVDGFAKDLAESWKKIKADYLNSVDR